MDKRKTLFIHSSLWLLLFIFFLKIFPLVPYDGDDWLFIGTMRQPFPMWRVFNPTRVLPEVLMPMTGYFSAYIVYPLTHNYIWSIIGSSAAVLSLFITFFCYEFYNLLRKKFKVSNKSALGTEFFFLLSFFLLYKRLWFPSYTGFWSIDLTCVYFYIIPGLLNATLLFYMEQSRNYVEVFKQNNSLRRGIFILAVYFAVFSNSQFNVILALYAFFKMIAIGNDYLKNNHNLFNFDLLNKIWIYIVILLMWLLSIFFDLHGDRAKSVSTSNVRKNGLSDVLIEFRHLIEKSNHIFLIFSFILIAIVITLIIFNQQKSNKLYLLDIIIALLSCAISFVYLILAYLKAGAFYASRPDAMWPVMFFFLFAVSLSVSFLLIHYSLIRSLTPLFLICGFLISFNFNNLYIPMGNVAHSTETAVSVDNYIINQVVRADKSGKSKVTVKVPVDNKNNRNWPHSYDMPIWLQNTLYSHGLIRTRIKIIFKPSSSVNKRFFENTKDEQPFVPLEIRK